MVGWLVGCDGELDLDLNLDLELGLDLDLGLERMGEWVG